MFSQMNLLLLRNKALVRTYSLYNFGSQVYVINFTGLKFISAIYFTIFIQVLKLLPMSHLYIQLSQLVANQQDLDELKSIQNLHSELLHAFNF